MTKIQRICTDFFLIRVNQLNPRYPRSIKVCELVSLFAYTVGKKTISQKQVRNS